MRLTIVLMQPAVRRIVSHLTPKNNEKQISTLFLNPITFKVELLVNKLAAIKLFSSLTMITFIETTRMDNTI